jgi:flagellar basal-body rod protein FlgF
MDRSLYIAMSGAKENLLAQGLNANNLANVNSDGFKADLEQARSMPVFGPGFPSRAYAMTERPATDFKAGGFKTTGRDLDVAIQGQGWIAVQSKDGSEAYTRTGDLQTTPDGRLLTGDGLPVLSADGPIVLPPYQKIEVGEDGTISVIPLGDLPPGVAAVNQIKLVNPPLDQLEKGLDGLMRVRGGGPQAGSADVKLVSGALESSNVNPVESMVHMIELQRQFELNIKMMKTLEDTEASGSQIMKLA